MKKSFWIALIILAAAGLACNLPLGINRTGSTSEVLPDADSENFTVSARTAFLEPEPLSSAQRQILSAKGTPNRFMILFLDGVREETWYYDYLGYEVTFRNGDIFTEGESSVTDISVTIYSDFSPWEFNGEMGLSELLTVNGSESFVVEPLDDVFKDDISLVYMDGLDAGFRNDKLVFVRVIPLKLSDQDLPAGDGLTPEEAAHQGTHTYQVYCVYSDGLIDEYEDTKTWSFEGDGVDIDGMEFISKIAENHYGFSDEDGEYNIIFEENIVVLTGGFFEENVEGTIDYITFTCKMTP